MLVHRQIDVLLRALRATAITALVVGESGVPSRTIAMVLGGTTTATTAMRRMDGDGVRDGGKPPRTVTPEPLLRMPHTRRTTR